MRDGKSGVQQRNHVMVYIGTTLWIAWSARMLVFSSYSSFLVSHPDQPWLQGALPMGYAIGAVLLLLGGRQLFSRYRLSSIVSVLSLICAALGTFGGSVAQRDPVVSMPLLITLGAFMLIITVLWMCIVCVRSSSGLYGSMGATTTIGIATGFALSELGSTPVASAAVTAALIASLVCLVFTTDSTLGSDTALVPHGEERPLERPESFPPMALVAGAIVWIVLGFAVVLWTKGSAGIEVDTQSLLAALGGMLAALAFAAVGSRYRNADKLGFAILGLMVACLGSGLYMLQAPAFPAEAALVLLAAGFTLFHLYGKVLNLDVSYQAAESPLITFAQASTVNYNAALAGGLLASVLPVSWEEPPFVSVFVLVLIFLLVFANGTLFSRKNIGTRWGLVARQAATLREETTVDEPSEHELFLDAVEALTAQASLTPREAEVLVLLVQGHRAKQIESALGISLGTVRNHINHAYMKLGVHSYDELRALIEEQVQKPQ